MTRARILLVDDSETVLFILQTALEEHFDVETAPDGASGLARARQSHPDLVVTDSLMPGLDGLGLLKALKADPATQTIPVIVLTSEELTDVASAAGSIQPAAVLVKSMDISPLVDAIRTALTRRS
jgi:CheY-like chemotaxis protein